MSHKVKSTLSEWRFLCSHFTLFTLCNLQPLALLYAPWRTRTFFLPLGLCITYSFFLEYPLPDFCTASSLSIQVLTHMLPPLKKTWQPYLNSLFLLSTTYCFIPLLGTITTFHSINTILNYAVWLFFPIFPLPTHLCLSWIEAIWEKVLSVLLTVSPSRPRKYLTQNGHFIHIHWIKTFLELLLRSITTGYNIYSDIFLDVSLLFECDPRPPWDDEGRGPPEK